jgi:C-methyltransferase C-terminal domain/Putative zinc binding domain/Methyltransferase domain
LHLTYRKTCRICGSSALTKVIDLGEQYLQGSFVKPGKTMPPLRRIPMELVRCDPTRDENACGLLQMSVTVPPEILYASYWYRSGTNQTMRNHLSGIAEQAASLIKKGSAVALDIGCNDGTLLRCYPTSFLRLGVDPSDIAKGVEGDLKIIQDFFPSAALHTFLGDKRCDIITSIAMFYDLEEPLRFVRGLKSVLSREGIWIFEMSYMPAMLEVNSYDTICHEHLEYYSFSVIERLLRMCGMKVVNVTFNDINGGSIRCYATHDDCFKYINPAFQESIANVRSKEFELELDTDKPYRHFQERINSHKQQLSALLKDLRRNGKTIHAYGASTKGNTILQWCGIDHTIVPYAADRNPEKAGARTIGTDIAIISEEESRAMKPDYYLVLPWHFRDEFIAREAEILADGTNFIFPLPSIETVGYAAIGG